MEMRWSRRVSPSLPANKVCKIKMSWSQTTRALIVFISCFFFFSFSELTESHNFSARAHIFVLHRWRWMMHTVISTDMLVKMYLKLVLGCISLIKYAPIFLLFLYPFVLATCYWDACTLYFWNSMVFQLKKKDQNSYFYRYAGENVKIKILTFLVKLSYVVNSL